MGVLPDWAIERDVKITPFEKYNPDRQKGMVSYGLASYGYDARIGYKFKVFKPTHCPVVDPLNFPLDAFDEIDRTPKPHEWGPWVDTPAGPIKTCENCGKWSHIPHEKDQCMFPPNFVLVPPHGFLLGETIETFTIPRDCLCVVIGKSTYARCGLVVNVTPGEPEWTGRWTVELSNTTHLPIKVYCGQGIMQCFFLRSDGWREWAWRRLVRLWDRVYLGSTPGDREVMPPTKETVGCEVSYLDKKGRYMHQDGLTLPTGVQ